MAAVAALIVVALPATAADIVNAPEALELVRNRTVTMVDVRTPVEWADTGIPAGSHPVSLNRPDFVQGVLALTNGDRNVPLVLICRTGNRSSRALTALQENGFTHVSHVPEGMAGSAAGPGWLARGLPVEEWHQP